MMPEMTLVRNENQSSVDIEKNSKGYNFSVKVYDFDDEKLKTRIKELVSFVEKEITCKEVQQ